MKTIGIIGPANSGKSSFTNSLFGNFESPVSGGLNALTIKKFSTDKSLFASFNGKIYDFPCWRVEKICDYLDTCDLIIYVTDGRQCFTSVREHEMFTRILERIELNNKRNLLPYDLIVVANKIETDGKELAEMREQVETKYGVIVIPYSSHNVFMQQRYNMRGTLGRTDPKWLGEYRYIKKNAGSDYKEFDRSVRELQKWVCGHNSRQTKNLHANIFKNHIKIFKVLTRICKKMDKQGKTFSAKHLNKENQDVISFLMGKACQKEICFNARYILHKNGVILEKDFWMNVEELEKYKDAVKDIPIVRLYNDILALSSRTKTVLISRNYEFKDLMKIFDETVYLSVLHINSDHDSYKKVEWDSYITAADKIISLTRQCLGSILSANVANKVISAKESTVDKSTDEKLDKSTIDAARIVEYFWNNHYQNNVKYFENYIIKFKQVNLYREALNVLMSDDFIGFQIYNHMKAMDPLFDDKWIIVAYNFNPEAVKKEPISGKQIWEKYYDKYPKYFWKHKEKFGIQTEIVKYLSIAGWETVYDYLSANSGFKEYWDKVAESFDPKDLEE